MKKMKKLVLGVAGFGVLLACLGYYFPAQATALRTLVLTTLTATTATITTLTVSTTLTIPDSSVETAKIKVGAINTHKLAAAAVDTIKIAAQSINTTKMVRSEPETNKILCMRDDGALGKCLAGSIINADCRCVNF